MPYLSRIYLNPLRKKCQFFLRNPQALHACILGGVPEQPVEQRMLWRVEPGPRTRAELLVLTQTRPSWEHLVEQAGWPGSDQEQYAVADMEPLLASLTLGRRYALRATVNPVVSVAGEPGVRRGKVVPLKSGDQLAWFAERLPRWGFQATTNSLDTPAVMPVERRKLVFAKTDGNRVTLELATMEAIIEVTDVERARRSLITGVGRARAYGSGLVTLAPAR